MTEQPGCAVIYLLGAISVDTLICHLWPFNAQNAVPSKQLEILAELRGLERR
jgi:hypothetical protein